MKRYTPLWVFVLTLQLSFSCMRQDLSACLDGNLMLSFSCEEGGQEVFSEVVSSVDILLFDTLYQLAYYERIEDPGVLAEKCVTLEIAAGGYYLVAWANRGENTTYGVLREAHLFSDCLLTLTGNGVGDPLYYGPKERAGGTIPLHVEVREGEDREETIRFTRAHRTFRFYVEGVKDEYNGEQLPPLIDIRYVPEGYDFLMNLRESREVEFTTRTDLVTVGSKRMACREMYLPLYPLTRDIEVEIIKNSDNSSLTVFNLAAYLSENPPQDEYEIDIHIGFFSGGIEISVPGWNSSEEVTPGW
ncbi:MAG: FimB/Mfa2 family fimbrial subunit [Tannerellaceae bacterium]|nr:FimB/Mfa2 family fimbrial subunit [Tannerellaceae bacterium]